MFNFFKKKQPLIGFEESIQLQLSSLVNQFNLKLISEDKLLGKAPHKIKYAFSHRFYSYSKLINILLLPQSISFNEKLEKELLNLRDYILSKNCMLVVIYEQILEYDKVDHINEFLLEAFDTCSDNYYTFPYYKEYQDNVLKGLSDLLLGKIYFRGPKVGKQIINIETALDECWRCKEQMMTVTGIVFPNKTLNDWKNTQWQYYLQSIPITSVPLKYIKIVSKEVESLRLNNGKITPLKLKYSNFRKESYWAACCPHCDALRGDNYIHEVIMPYLHDIKSRLTPSLNYYSLEIEVQQDFLDVLYGGGCDTSHHSCDAGWMKRE